MTDMTDPNAAFYELYGGRTNALRNVFGDPGQVHPNTPNIYLNNPKQQSTLFGYNPEINKIQEEYGFDFAGVMDVEDKAAAAEAQDIWMSNEVWENFLRAPGGKRQARGFEYGNNARTVINPERRVKDPITGKFTIIGGAFNVETGESVSTGPVSFNKDREEDIEIPTSTENPERPRTVAAAFDNQRSIITLVFRDGTIYNYYNCTQKMWDDFKGNSSKWEYIRDTLDKQPRGIANMENIPEELRIIAYGRARGEQVRKAKAGGWQPRTRVRYFGMSQVKASGGNPKMVRVRSKGK